MKGIYIALALLFAASFTARLDAQIAISEDMFGRTSFTVKAQVLDSLTREPIAFASAYLRHPKDTVITSFALTDTLGKAELKKVAKGEHLLCIEYLGYRPVYKKIYVRGNYDAKTILMRPDDKMLKAASVSAVGTPMEMKGDTLVYNASSFRVMSNDNLADLLKKMPGVEVGEDGTVKVNGKEVKINSPLDAMKLGMAYLPEDRKAEGIIADLSVRENIIIALQAKRGMFHPLSKKEMEDAADKYIKLLQIKTASRETPIKSLSGGNQQKVILGRWLLTNPDYLILDEPTRGIDIGTKTEIQKLVLDLADQGMAVTFISSEVEEMLRTCSRMAVLRDGQKVGELEEDELSQSGVMKAIAGGDDK